MLLQHTYNKLMMLVSPLPNNHLHCFYTKCPPGIDLTQSSLERTETTHTNAIAACHQFNHPLIIGYGYSVTGYEILVLLRLS